MIPNDQLKELREHLVKAKNPLFLFDSDPDGICSFLLFRKFCGKGYWTMVKSTPIVDMNYIKKVENYNPDIIFILDKPLVSQEFIDAANRPIVWLDHHPATKMERVKYYNPRIKDPQDNRPTSYWAYQVVKENLWLGVIGSIADWHFPEFAEEFSKEYPDLLPKDIKTVEKALYESEIGKIIEIIAFNLKGESKDVKGSVSSMIKINSPYEILKQDSSQAKYVCKRAIKIKKEYDSLIKDANKKINEKENIIVYVYPSRKTSLTAEIANVLLYRYPDKVIVVGREKNDEIKMSLRYMKGNLPTIIETALVGLNGFGGGHEHSSGCTVSKSDFPTFIEAIKAQISS